MKIEVELSEDVIQRLADAVADRVGAIVEEKQGGLQYMSVEEAAAYLRCSKHRIYDLTSRRSLPHFKFGSRLLFSQKELDAWLADSKIESRPPYRPSDEPPPRRTSRTKREIANPKEKPKETRKRECPCHPRTRSTRTTRTVLRGLSA